MTEDTSAKLMKWPSLRGERISPNDGAIPYAVMEGSLRDCVANLQSKPAASHGLYEIRLRDGSVLSAAEAIARVNECNPPS